MTEPLRIAMWSGPRNISTAMMRAWENRADTEVVDEPFYAYYLDRTGADHPGKEDVIADGETDWRVVVDRLTGDAPGDAAVFYQKQMTHHLLPEIDRRWLACVRNGFLIRDPREVILSYLKRRGSVTADDVGIPHQAEIFDYVCDVTGETPPVLDARDVLSDPRRALSRFCDRLGLSFSESMLAWPAGPRASDGIWARHWYDDVVASTGFRAYRESEGELPDHAEAVLRECRPHYERLREHRIL